MNMDTATRERMKSEFDICYVMAKEGIAFLKYAALYDLKSWHDVDLGVAYSKDVSAKCFTGFIAQSQCDCLFRSLTKLHFFKWICHFALWPVILRYGLS